MPSREQPSCKRRKGETDVVSILADSDDKQDGAEPANRQWNSMTMILRYKKFPLFEPYCCIKKRQILLLPTGDQKYCNSHNGPYLKLRQQGRKLKVKVWTLAIVPLTWVRLVTGSALQFREWQRIGMSQWCRSALCGHPLPAHSSGPGVRRTRNLLVTSPILCQLDHCTHGGNDFKVMKVKGVAYVFPSADVYIFNLIIWYILNLETSFHLFYV